MKTLSTLALATALVGSFALTAQAGTVTEYSNTWKPGYSLDDSGAERYSRTTYVEADTGYNSGAATVVKTETSVTPKAGFYLDDATHNYVRQITIPNPQGVENKPTVHSSNTWAPGLYADDNGTYSKL